MEWKEKYPRNKKPAFDELLAYLKPHIRDLFLVFHDEMLNQYKVQNKYHRFSNTAGWTYGYGRSYNCELLTVTIFSECFWVLGVSVKDDDSLKKALQEAQKAYDKGEGFEARYTETSTKRREKQIIRSKARLEREKAEMKELTENIDTKKFNKFNWCKKVSRNDILRLYQSDARGMLDEELLDEVGFTFYTRCRQATEARKLMDKGQILCLHCGAVIKASSYTLPVQCECGYSYTYREYRRSCNTANMPGGRAMPIFESFLQNWPACKEAHEKMMLIDRLIHECHVTLMSGSKGRSVCINLIEGTLKQVSDMIMKLSYSVDLL